jgi:2-(1,2-epoxy-1,2-dihydrophenyl)acetyl-CoA isomerase
MYTVLSARFRAVSEACVLSERRGDVLIVTLNRPARRNGITAEMCQRLYEILLPIPSSDARVVVLRGAGDDFSVGADLTGGESTGTPSFEELGPSYHSSTLLHAMPQITIAAIDGGCAGAALGWACACDFRFASDRAKFATAFLKVGVSGDMGLTWSLPKLVGAARARELLFFPEKIDASEALELGLITRLFAPDALHDEVLARAETLASHHPFPLRMMKANLLSAERMDLGEYIEVESARHLHVAAGPSLRQGIEAFVRGRVDSED